MNKIILDLCGGTGAWSKPYSENGFDVKVITLPKNDVMDIRLYGISSIFIPDTDYSIGDDRDERINRLQEKKSINIHVGDIYGILAAPMHYAFTCKNDSQNRA